MTTLLIICGYLGLLLALGLLASRFFTGTKRDYQLASHSIGPFLLLMSVFGTTMTAFALVGSSGEAFKEGIGVYGMLASSSGIIHSLCFLVIGVKLWAWGKQHGYTTQIQFFRDRLESDKIGLLLFPILVGLVIPYLLIGVLSSGIVIQNMTGGTFPNVAAFATDNPGTSGGVPQSIGALVICLVVLTYVFFGGMRGTAWANAFQTCVFMVLGVVTFCVIANTLGGKASLWENLNTLGEAIPHDKASRSDMSQTKFFTYLLVPLSVGMFPHLFQHWLTAKSANSFKLPVVAHPIFIMIVWVPCVLIGVWATTNLIPDRPPLPSNPNAILPFLVKTQTGAVLGGLLTAGILAAIMSSLDSQFLCLGTIFMNDVVTHYAGRERFSDRQQVLLARAFIVGIVAVTYVLSLLQPVSVFAMGVWCFSGFTALFPIVTAALYWRGLSTWGAVSGILAAIVSWSIL
ncbi:MAG: sodium:solute symporter family protein, partial [Aeoliella sp.]